MPGTGRNAGQIRLFAGNGMGKFDNAGGNRFGKIVRIMVGV